MIDIHFIQNKRGHLTQLEIRGHAFFAEAGSDIVCAAVSTLALSLVNNIERMLEIQPDVQVDEEEGLLILRLLDNLEPDKQRVLQTLMRHTYLALSEDVSKTYPYYVQVTLHIQSTQ